MLCQDDMLADRRRLGSYIVVCSNVISRRIMIHKDALPHVVWSVFRILCKLRISTIFNRAYLHVQ